MTGCICGGEHHYVLSPSNEFCCSNCRHPVPVWRLVDVTGLELDAVRVVKRIVERLRMGQRQYGPLDLATNPRDWSAEATEEFLDGAIYMAMQSVKEKG